MDYEAPQALADELGGAISAHRFALESLFAMWLDGLGGGPENARTIGREMLRQFEELPPRLDGVDPERLFAVTQIGIHHLEQMWATIEARWARSRRRGTETANRLASVEERGDPLDFQFVERYPDPLKPNTLANELLGVPKEQYPPSTAFLAVEAQHRSSAP